MSAEQTPDIEALAAQLHVAHLAHIRWNVVYGDTFPVAECLNCQRYAEHAAPVLAAADERAYLRGYEAGLLAPQSEWMKARDRDLREAEQRALREAADEIQALHPGETKNSVIFLRDRAGRVAEPQHEAATSGKESEASDE